MIMTGGIHDTLNGEGRELMWRLNKTKQKLFFSQ